LEQQELYGGTATAGVPVSNCGRDLQKLPHPAGHMTQGSGSLVSPPPPAMIQYGLGWRYTCGQTTGIIYNILGVCIGSYQLQTQYTAFTLRL